MGNECFDIDECTDEKLNDCPDNSDCVNTDGSYICKCEDGFVGPIDTGDTKKCFNINECLDSTSCEFGSNAFCEDTNGSFECSCPSNMLGTGYIGDPCIEKPLEQAVVPDTCESSCKPGYFSVGLKSGQACFDFDECRDASLNNCYESNCVNTDGSYICTCPDGFELYFSAANFYGCANINECTSADSCELDSGAICTDTIGSFECSCPSNMQGTGYIGDPCQSPNNCHKITEIEYNLQSKSRFRFHTEGENTIVYRIRLPQVPETTEYTGFFAFSAKYCGEDFIKQLSSGKIM